MPNKVALRFILLSAPSFLLWWILYTPVIAPAYTSAANKLIEGTFSPIKFTLEVRKDGGWNLGSNVQMKEQPHRAEGRLLLQSYKLANNKNMSMGIPLFWTVFLAFFFKGRDSIKPLLIGTALLVPIIAISYIIDALWQAQTAISNMTHQVIHLPAPLKATVRMVSEHHLLILENLRRAFVYLGVIFFPLCIVYLTNRSTINQAIKGQKPTDINNLDKE